MTDHRARRYPSHLAGLVTAAIMCLAVPLVAGQGSPVRQFTAADYARAERFLAPATTTLVVGLNVQANWLNDGRFWYRRIGSGINEFVLVDPVKKSRPPAFDHAKVAAVLPSAAGRSTDPRNLPFTVLEFTADGQEFHLTGGGTPVTCRADSSNCRLSSGERPAGTPAGGQGRAGGGGRGGAAAGLSPDGRRLDEERRAGRRLVARFEEDRDVPARWPQRRRDVSRQHDGRTSHAAGLEIPAAR